jgi:hypothetical protein
MRAADDLDAASIKLFFRGAPGRAARAARA